MNTEQLCRPLAKGARPISVTHTILTYPAVSEDRGRTSKVDGPESLAISICDVSYKLMNLKIILISHCPCDGVRRQVSYSKSRCRHFHFGELAAPFNHRTCDPIILRSGVWWLRTSSTWKFTAH